MYLAELQVVFAMSPSDSVSSTPEVAQYLARKQCAVQWRGFLRALAEEFTSALSPDDLRALMLRVGVRFAAEHSLQASVTLPELQERMSAVWAHIDWGWVLLHQGPEHLNIEHNLSPLAAAFGSEHAVWVGGFLEGVYQTWFAAAGAGQLTVVQVQPADGWGSVRLQLSR